MQVRRLNSESPTRLTASGSRESSDTRNLIPKSVLLVTYHFPPEIGGIHTRTLHYVQNLRRRGIDVTVFFIVSHGSEIRKYFVSGAEVLVLPGQTRFFPRIAFRLLKTSVLKRVDVIHVVTGASTLVGVVAVLLGRVMRRPSVISFFGKEQFEFLTPMHRWLFKIAISLATSVGVNTPYTASSIPHKFRNKVHLLLGGAEEWKTERPSGAHQSQRIVLFVGRLASTKGVDDLVRAFQLVLREIPEAKLVIVGEGPERESLGQLSSILGVGSRVEFRGTLTGSALHDEYERSSVVVLPSKYVKGEASSETLGLTLIEASMHSKPLVGTSHGGIPEIVKDGRNGLLVPENNPRALADALIRILSDEHLSRLLGVEALRIARSQFSWDTATDRLLQSYVR